MFTWPLILLAQAALAGPNVVLFSGDPDVALHRVAADTGIPVWELTPVDVLDLFPNGTAMAIGMGQPALCAAPPVKNAPLRDTLTRVEARIVYQEQYEEALSALGAAAASLGCLSEPAEASLGGRLFFLEGVSAAGLDRTDESRAAFAHALMFQPTLEWDDKFSPKLRGPFDAAVTAAASAPKRSILLGPGFQGVTDLWVDGQRFQPTAGGLALGDGPHLVQVLGPQVFTVQVLASEHPSALVFPEALSGSILDALDTPAGQTLVQALIDHVLPADATTYAWSGARTWRTGAWEALAPSELLLRERRRSLATKVLVAGGVAGSLGLVAGGTGLGLWAANRVADGPEETEAYGARMARAGAGSALFDAGLVGVGVGLGCVTFAVAW